MTPRPFLFVLLLVAGCAPDPAPIPATPAIWRVADGSAEVLLLGTIHVLPDGVDWRRGRVAGAIARADVLVLEIADIGDAEAQAARFAAIGRAEGLPPLIQRAPALADELRRIAGDTGPPLATLDGMKTWAAALALGAGLWRDVEAKRENGVDAVLAAAFAEAGKPVSGLETADAQFALFDGLNEADQSALLARVVADARDPDTRFAAMLDAWAKGDTRAIAATFDDAMRASPTLAQALIDKRNAAWADRIAGRLRGGSTVLVAVGAGHLAGEGSLQARLAAKGFSVKRVQ